MHGQVGRNSEPIAGYRIRECLGAGGYGEVWKAEAPGGLMKAIKFVYGRHDDQRAASELKALERIKSVRHPFLLSLERIEVLEGQLVIVTELAEGSLRDRFNACRREGLPGIPRNELLLYLRDAAEALDFMTHHHSLQHLDVKAENLLLLSGRVKVADFGLVKDFRHVSGSLMGGLTPLYAAPEVFRGSPSRCSDQYSLALVYEEMLTGDLPFRADTPAELTLRHLNDAPDLTSLPQADRPVIARALAKDPANRFQNCLALVTALMHSSPTVSAQPDSARDSDTPGQEEAQLGGDLAFMHEGGDPVRTLACEEFGVPSTSAGDCVSLELPPLPEPASVELGPMTLTTVDRPLVPTLFLGIGGTAIKVLRHLRSRFQDRFGEHVSLPAMSMLLLDTDARSLNEASRPGSGSALAPEELLELPLKRPQQYRAESGKLLRWLGRRWLYNIPRSLKTEGLRPLGRLALVDHAPQVLERLRQAILQVTDAEGIANSTKQTGLEFDRGAVRVYLVASISGGTGSGMVLDVAYAVRTILGELGLSNAEVFGILTHSTGTNPRYREVSTVNAFSWITEYNTFNRPGGAYPGEESCGVPRFESGRPAFEHAYLVHLGDGLREEDLNKEAELVADYLYLDSITSVGAFLGACRKEWCDTPSPLPGQARLRTFGMQRINCLQRDVAEATVRELSRMVVREWSGTEIPTPEVRPATLWRFPFARGTPENDSILVEAAEFATALRLSAAGLMDEMHALIHRELRAEPPTFFQNMLADLSASGIRCSGDAVKLMDQLFGLGAPGDDPAELPAEVLNRPLRELIGPALHRLATDLEHWIVRQLDRPQVRNRGARRLAHWFAQYLRRLDEDTIRTLESLREKRAALIGVARLHETEISSKRQALFKYFSLARDECVARGMQGLISYLSTELRSTTQRLVEVEVELEQMASMLHEASWTSKSEDLSGPTGSMTHTLRAVLRETLESSKTDMALKIQETLRAEYLEEHGGLYEAIRRGGSPLLSAVRIAARRVVLEAMAQTDLLSRILPAPGTVEGGLRGSLQQVMPRLSQFGGRSRLIVSLPKAAMTNGLSNQLRQELQDSATLLTGEPNELTFCYELAGLSLAHIAVGIINSRYDFAKLAARAHTRSDVLWASLTDARILGVEDQAEGSSHVAPVSAPSADWAVEVPSSEFGM